MNSDPISRREFIAGTAVPRGSPSPRGRAATAERPAGRYLRSTRMCTFTTRRPGGVPWPRRSDPGDASILHPHLPDDFARRTAPFHVLGEVVVEASPLYEDNQWVLDLARDHDGIVGFIGRLAPERRFRPRPAPLRGQPAVSRHPPVGRFAPADRRTRLSQRSVAAGGPAADARRSRARRRLAGRPPRPARASKLRIVIEHLPYAEWDGRPAAMRAALAEAAACPNVYAKVSNVIRLSGGGTSPIPPITAPASTSSGISSAPGA